MRPRVLLESLAALPLLGLVLACQSSPEPKPSPPEAQLEQAQPAPLATSGRAAEFSADRAWQDLVALSDMGPRYVGSPGHGKAVRYLTDQLEKLGLVVEAPGSDTRLMLPPTAGGGEPKPTSFADLGLSVSNLYATIPGTHSSDEIVLVAGLDTRYIPGVDFIGANEGASGDAVVLELARVIAADPLPYATMIALLDGEGPFPLPGRTGPDGKPVTVTGAGSRDLAARLDKEGISRVRLLVYFDRVGDADLKIARDLMSDRLYREEFWKAAEHLGLTRAFPPHAPFDASVPDHSSLRNAGLRRIVSLVDTSYGGDEPPGLYARTKQDTPQRCSPESLGTVGAVALEGLDEITTRLVKIDRFTQPSSPTGPMPVTDDLQPQDTRSGDAAPEPQGADPAAP